MKYLEPKAPDSTKFYVIDYSKLLGPDGIDTFTIEVTSGTVEITNKVSNATAVGFFLSGGIAGETDTFDIKINTISKQIFPDQASMLIVEHEYDIDFSVITKNQIILWAWEDLRLSGYIFDHTPDENQAMLNRLDGMMREARLLNADPGYNHPPNIGQSNLNDIAGIPDGLGMSIATLLARTYMDGKGKSATPSFIAKYNRAKGIVYSYCRGIPLRPIPIGTPHGAGMINFSTYFPFFTNTINTNKGALLSGLNGQIITAAVWDEALWG